MRIAVNAWFWNQPATGSGQYTRRLVEALGALAPEIEIRLVFPAPGGYRVAAPAEADAAQPARTPPNAAKLRFEQVDFPRVARALRADLAHVPYWAPPLHCAVPLVATVHDIIPRVLREYRGGPAVRAYTALVSAATRGASAVLTDSEASKRDIVAHLGVPAERVYAVPLAATPAAAPATADATVREKYHLPDEYVLYLGSFEARKNVAALLAAYTWVAGALRDQLPLVLGGRQHPPDGRLYPDVQAQARACGLLAPESGTATDIARFIGAPDDADKPALYRGATAFAFMSVYEGFGLPPLEAMACGTPVVVSNAASLPEVVDGAGYVLDPDDTRGIAGAILALYNQPELAEQLRARGLAQAAQFSWERTARETLAVYRQVLGP